MSLLLWAQAALRQAADAASRFSIDRTLDRTFTDTPASGGGNVSPDTFEYNGQTWEVWQVVPFLGAAVSSAGVGRCRVHLRNRAVNRGSMQLTDMPRQIIISAVGAQTADWTGLPWTFNRPASGATFTSPGSGNAARRSLDYDPVRNVAGQTPAGAGVAQGETFTATLVF